MRFVTAHGVDAVEAMDWASLARPRQTLALYMGVASLGRIAEPLLLHGIESSTPVAVVENGSRADQRITLATLESLGDLAQRGDVQSPALLIVGEVAALAARLHWFGEPPRHWQALARVA